MADASADTSDYLQPYREAIATHGPGFKATLWGTERAQRLRFDVAHALSDFTGCTILDAGCGRGDLAAHLAEAAVEYSAYHGIDAMAAMVDDAQARHLPRATFEAADFVTHPDVFQREPAADYIVFSGTLNTMDDPTARRLISAAFTAAAQGVVFNFLSDRHHERWAERDLTPARRFDTVAWLDWALQQTSRVAFAQDYLDGHDATILMRHD